MSKQQTVPALAVRDEADYQTALAQVRVVRDLQHRYAAAIIGAGLFSNSELWSGILAVLAEREVARQKPESADDGPLTKAIAWGDAGFLLGLAVGMQLGPHAFDGGAK